MTLPMPMDKRMLAYARQVGSFKFTPKQRRRIKHKANRSEKHGLPVVVQEQKEESDGASS